MKEDFEAEKKKYFSPIRFGKTKKGSYFCALGEMAEWSIAAVLKTVDLHGSGGSNPSPSAKQTKQKGVEHSTPFVFRSVVANLCA